MSNFRLSGHLVSIAADGALYLGGVTVELRDRSARYWLNLWGPHRRLLGAILIPTTGQVKTNSSAVVEPFP